MRKRVLKVIFIFIFIGTSLFLIILGYKIGEERFTHTKELILCNNTQKTFIKKENINYYIECNKYGAKEKSKKILSETLSFGNYSVIKTWSEYNYLLNIFLSLVFFLASIFIFYFTYKIYLYVVYGYSIFKRDRFINYFFNK